jgi:hypothetical protein
MVTETDAGWFVRKPPVHEAPAAVQSPPGWGALEYAEHNAREALTAWENRPSEAMPRACRERALLLAEATRKLLWQLEIERGLRHGRA